MTLTQPGAISETIYYTRRTLLGEHEGEAVAWAYKKECPECKNAKMGKPVDEKTGKIKIRAKEYVCPECNYTEEKKEHEESLTIEIQYTCPHCGKEGEGTTPMKRKSFTLPNDKKAPAYIVDCEHCSGKIAITKKMKN